MSPPSIVSLARWFLEFPFVCKWMQLSYVVSSLFTLQMWFSNCINNITVKPGDFRNNRRLIFNSSNLFLRGNYLMTEIFTGSPNLAVYKLRDFDILTVLKDWWYNHIQAAVQHSSDSKPSHYLHDIIDSIVRLMVERVLCPRQISVQKACNCTTSCSV